MAVSNILSRFTSNKQQNIVSLFVSTSRVVIGVMKSGRLHVESLDVASDPWQSAQQLLQKLAITRVGVNLILGHGLYQGLLIDNPGLSEQDKRLALPFKIKDFISESPMEVIADGYLLPFGDRFNVYATNKANIINFAKYLHTRQCYLNLVSVESVSLKQWTQSDKTEMVLSSDGQGALLLSVFSENRMCFQRQVRGLVIEGRNLADELIDELALEIQRSLDYFKTQLKSVQVTALVVAAENVSNTELALKLTSRLTIAVRPQPALEQAEPHRQILKALLEQTAADAEINLYYPELLPQQPWLTFDKMVATWGCACLLVAGIAGYQHWKLNKTEKMLLGVTTELNISKRLFEELQERLKLHVPSLALVNEVELAENKILSQRLALDAVSQHDQALQQGYASTFGAMARLARPDISVDTFFVSLPRLDITGEARYPESVPVWVQTFQTEPTLAKREFEQMEISRDDKKRLMFKLISQREKAKGTIR